MRILITAGATREPLDAVRFISNVSTGATGVTLAEALRSRGHRVTLLRSEGALHPAGLRDVEVFSSAQDLGQRLRARLRGGRFDAVIMAAAVSDYRPANRRADKISSAAPKLTIRLVRNAKLLPRLKSFSPRPLQVVGFKLTVGAGAAKRQAAVTAQLSDGRVDAVVHNDLAEIRRAAEHPYRLFRVGGRPRRYAGARALAAALEALLSGP